MLDKLNAGGWLAGKKTYVLVVLAVLSLVGQWAIGEATLTDLARQLPELLGLSSIAAVRAGIALHAAQQAPHLEELKQLLREAAEPIPVAELQAGGYALASAPSDLDKLIDAYNQAREHHPFLLIEIGHNRVADWVVTVWNSQGTGIKDAQKVFQKQDISLTRLCQESMWALRDEFPEAWD